MVPREETAARLPGPQEEPGLGQKAEAKTGKGEPRSLPLLGFPRKRQGRTG